jgi:purine/pyrimidine-nucleoside phosphorylase
MINVNEYFDGKVKSLGFKNSEGKLSAGVLKKGTYEFSTSTKEWMTLTSGKWELSLPGVAAKSYDLGETCAIPQGISFTVHAKEDSSYLCRYE